jgi:hypothetical protein
VYFAQLDGKTFTLETERFNTRDELKAYLDRCKARGYVEGTVGEAFDETSYTGRFMTCPIEQFGYFTTLIFDENE